MSVPDGRGRRVLVVAQRFPPHGGGGVQRTAYFVRYLHEFGWRPHVLTLPAEDRHVLDHSLMELIPADVPVTRTRPHDGLRVYRAFGKVRLAWAFRLLTPFLPNMEASWTPLAYRAGAEVLSREPFDLIYSSAYPMASHLTAHLLKRRFGLPWVADYRDEWSLRDVIPWPTPLHRRLARQLDRIFVRSADQVITTSPAHTESFSRAFEVKRPIRTITNGFDPADFLDGPAEPPSGHDPTRFLICHVGTVFSWRSPGSLVSAVADLVERGVIPANRIRIQFVGFGSPPEDEGLIDAGIIRHTDYVSHPEAVAWMRAADLLLLFNTEQSNIPGKTFEYLASRRPILALCADGPTCDVVREAGAGLVLQPGDEAGIARLLEEAYHRWSAGRPALETRHEGLKAYTRPELAKRLHQVFETVLA